MFLQIANTSGESTVKSVYFGRAFSSGSSEIRKDWNFLSKEGKLMFWRSSTPLSAYFFPRISDCSRFSVKIINLKLFSRLVALPPSCFLHRNNSLTRYRSRQLRSRHCEPYPRWEDIILLLSPPSDWRRQDLHTLFKSVSNLILIWYNVREVSRRETVLRAGLAKDDFLETMSPEWLDFNWQTEGILRKVAAWVRVTKAKMWRCERWQQQGREQERGEGEGGNASFHNQVKPRAVRLLWREDSARAGPSNLKFILLIWFLWSFPSSHCLYHTGLRGRLLPF